MAWLLATDDIRPDGVYSTLFQNNEKFCVTLEHAFEDSDGNYAPKVPRGVTYRCVRGEHQLDHGSPFITFEITGVPGHSGILLHAGNFNGNSDGCVLVGHTVQRLNSGWWIDNSRDTFSKLMAALADVDEFSLEVI